MPMFNQAVQAIQSGQLEEGARLLRLFLRDEPNPSVRAVAWLWLAETEPRPQFKVECYQYALKEDPSNADAQARLNFYLSQLPPQGVPPVRDTGTFAAVGSMPNPAPDPLVSMPLVEVAHARVVAILKGPNGQGSGFFLTQDGIIATTRSVVGMNALVDVRLENGQTLLGQVVRAFPVLDLAFVRVKARVQQLLPPTSAPALVDDTPLVAIVYPNTGVRTLRRSTRDQAPPHFFPTTIVDLPDAGGSPVLELQSGLLVGMLTKNKRSEANMCYGLHLSEIYRALELFRQEQQQAQHSGHYCHNCGAYSRVGGMGGFYCETCGGTLPYAVAQARLPQPHLIQAYGEIYSPCPSCGARVGYFNNACLRCGYDLVLRKGQGLF